MRFQITLEREGFFFLFEGTVESDLPRAEFGCVWAAVLVMCEESLFEIPSEPNVGLVRLIYTSDDVDVEHSPCSVLLRCRRQLRRASRRARFTKSGSALLYLRPFLPL
jgi:hypothetical protein